MANALSDMLSRYGVNYENAPSPTPALLAFMRGLGMTMDTAEDTKRTATQRIKERTTDAYGDIGRADERAKTNITTALAGDGMVRSGQANTRYAQQAEDTAQRRAGVARAEAEGLDAVNQAYMNTRDNLRQQALERVLSTDEQQQTRAATAAAQEQAWQRQDAANREAMAAQSAASDRAYQQQREAQDRMIEAMLRRYGG